MTPDGDQVAQIADCGEIFTSFQSAKPSMIHHVREVTLHSGQQ
jgi:hypothetical protein